jgi:quinol monooxygenase YgiN
MPVTYVVRMTAKGGQEDAARNRLLSNVPRIQETEPGNLAFAVHRALDAPRTLWLYET